MNDRTSKLMVSKLDGSAGNDKGLYLSRYLPTQNSWTGGSASSTVATGNPVSSLSHSSKVIIPSAMGKQSSMSYESVGSDITDEELKRELLANPVYSIKSKNLWEDKDKRNELLNENKTLIQNENSFPYYIRGHTDTTVAQYDYQITPGDPRYPNMVKLEDKLRDARAAFGIQVHGNNDIARAVKFNLYNRFKTSDTNLAFNRLGTHVFFTRPDLNLLNCYNGQVYGANRQIKDHSDTSLLYKTDPYIFRLLTDANRCGDSNNFNMLLSQQIISFDIVDEELSATEVGKTWGGHSMFYGDGYTGRHAGEITCQFAELQDLSVIKMMKLWITYIDNVSKGAWSPSYDLNGQAVVDKYGSYSNSWAGEVGLFSRSKSGSYVYEKTLDYPASLYVLKTDPTGDDILYWTKYYGIFPITTGSSVLSWDGTPVSTDPLKLNIRFKYCYKKDLSPISLVEFNEIAGIKDKIDDPFAVYESEASFNPSYNHSSRPYVGTPFIEIVNRQNTVKHGSNSDMFGKPRTQVKLRFLKNSDTRLNDDLLYRSPYSVKGSNNLDSNGVLNSKEVKLC